MVVRSLSCRGECYAGSRKRTKSAQEKPSHSLSTFFTFLAALLKRSMVACHIYRHEDPVSNATVHHMEIGPPTNVRHITHVTFDRFSGFLGLPLELHLQIPSSVPSASATAFGISTESLQCSYDSRGNSVPIILLLMQEQLYSQGGLKAEGIFRLTADKSHEDHVKDTLNRGIVPELIDIHCLAGLIKTWFRELPEGVLDDLAAEQVLQCNTEEDLVELTKQLMPTQAALLNWAVNLMADVVEKKEFNKMNARNIAMVFAPNMTRMSDPLTALMHAVQVMNLLKTLIIKALREREEALALGSLPFSVCSTEQHIVYSQRRMDPILELRGPNSDTDDFSTSSCSTGDEDKDGDKSSNDSQECFYQKLAECEVPTDDGPEEAEGGELVMEHFRNSSCFCLTMQSSLFHR